MTDLRLALCWYADDAARVDEGRPGPPGWRRVLQRAGEHGRVTARIRAIAPGVRDGHAGDPWKSPASNQVFIPAMRFDAQVRAFVTRNI
ncbi:MAG TPA: hypothetical protein VID31_11955, partial [Streptosporangiaceae bacterium]